jgi:hypothetical protein
LAFQILQIRYGSGSARNIQGSGTLFKTMASQVAPYVAMLAQYDSRIPTTFFGIVAIVAAVLVTFLPETSHTPLPDTIEVRLCS